MQSTIKPKKVQAILQMEMKDKYPDTIHFKFC